MADDSLTLDEMRRMAEEIGLARLSDEHLRQLLKATRIARARRASLPVATLVPADEPAHVYRLPSSLPLLPSGEGNVQPPLSPRERERG